MSVTRQDLIDRIRSLPADRQRALIALLGKQGVDVSGLDPAGTAGTAGPGSTAGTAGTAGAARTVPNVPRSADDPVRLSFTQQRLWFLAQLEQSGSHYNIPMGMRLTGPLDRPALLRALHEVVRRHEVLRTRFVDHDGVPYQHIEDGADFDIREEELAGPGELPGICAQETTAPFDLEQGPLIRARLLRQSEQEHILLVTMHHSVSDGWSVGVFVRDTTALYEAFSAGRPDPLEPLPVQYADYAHWQRTWLDGEVRSRQLGYWTEQLAGVDPTLSLPADRDRPATKTYNGDRETFHCPAEQLDALRKTAARHGATLYMTLLAAYTALLHGYTRRTDVAVGTVVAGRGLPEVEQLIGFFANTLVMRADLEGDPSFTELLARVKKTALDAYAHQDVPFEAVVDSLHLDRNLSHSPVFQTMFVLQEALTEREFQVGDLSVTPVEFDVDQTEFDLTLDLRETPDGLAGTVEYNTDLYDRDTVRRFIRHYTALLSAVTADPTAPLSRLGMLDDEERHQVLHTWNDTARPFSDHSCLHELFEERAARHPGRTALVDAEGSWTYADLNAWANGIAHGLRRHGVGPDAPVGLCLERSAEMVAGILGVLKAGGAYMPIEPSYPGSRIAEMVDGSGTEVVLTQPHLDSGDLAGAAHVLTLHRDGTLRDPAGEDVTGQHTDDLPAAETGLTPGHLAYVMHTSGSTGRPKGVMIEHRAAVNRIEWMQNEYGLTEDDVVLQKTPFSFDVSVWEFFWPLLAGARLAVLEPEAHRDPARLLDAVERFGVTTLHFVPSMLRQIVAEPGWPSCTSVRHVFSSGEALPPSVCADHAARHTAPLHNLYGPTEAAVDVSHWTCPDGPPPRTVPIGRPIQNIRLYVLNDARRPQGVGCAGELYIAGAGLARGYLHQPELTRERFVPDPFSDEPGARMYRTGDLARWLPDGTLEYLGRADDQVKLRGFRIEPGEIERRLAEHPAVRDCAVLLREDQPGTSRLVAYTVLRDDRQPGDARAELARHCAATLPDFMVPSAFVTLDALPVTANGKLDRKALPAPGIESFARQDYVAPSTPTEQLLAALWAELLGFEAERVGAADNFFALGGHSLLITVLVARLRGHGLPATVRAVFGAQTLADLAAELDAAESGTGYDVPENLIPLGCARITPDMLPLVDLSQEQTDAIVATVPGGAPNVQDIYPLASAQEGILFHHLLDPANDPFLVSILMAADDEDTAARFAHAVQALIDRHDVLRTAVLTTGLPEPVQVVHRTARLTVERTRLDPGEDAERQARALLERLDGMAVDRAPLLRLVIAEDPGSERRYLLLTAHHLIEDATSLRLTLEELAAQLTGRAELLAAPAPYRDFVAHTQHQLASDDAESYFRAVLGDVTEPTTPFGLTNVRGDAHRYPQLRRPLPAELTREIRAQSQRLRISPACLFHAAWACVAAATSGRDDVTFGTVMSGRLQGVPGVERMLGNFVNTLPLHVALTGRSVQDLVADVDSGLQELIAREQSPLSLAQRGSGMDSDTPLFSSVINFRHFERGGATAPRIEDHGLRWLGEADAINYPLTVSLDDFGHELSLHVIVEDAVPCETVAGHVETALAGIVRALAEDDGATTGALDVGILPEDERRHLLQESNALPPGLSTPDLCLHEWFEDMAARMPDAEAVEYAGTTLTYGELDARANRLARHLRELGVGPDVLVAVCLPRSEQIAVGVLAALKAGGAYVPLDPALPTERLEFVLRDSAPHALLVDGALPDGLTAPDLPVIDVRDDTEWAGQPDDGLTRAETGSAPTDLAYVIYTSGSTGLPKGVLVEHRNVTRLFTATREWFDFGPADVWTLFHSFAFDFSVWELWGALLHGGRLVVVEQAVTRNPAEFYALLCSAGVTVLNQTPSAFRQLTAAQGENGAPHQLRTVVFGGEALDVAALKPWMSRPANRDTRLVNMYGITETTVHVTHRPLTEADTDGSASPIGRRIPDLRTYVLDHHRRPVPAGVAGELYVGGAGVARGYLNRPELTAERFLPDPYADAPDGRMYRTGDLVRQLPDGSLEYLGRNDDQVKIRGFRIELGEIEAGLSRHEAVSHAVVVPHEATDGGRALVAYVSPTGTWLDRAAEDMNADLVGQWQGVFDNQYGKAPQDTADDLNLAGWDSSYTGEPIPEADMREWIDGTVRRIEELRPKRLLEVGCGTGLLLFRYADSCESVHALDLSATALDAVRRGVERREWSHVTLTEGDALTAEELPQGAFDTIVVNSVVQYFPNRPYLEDVLARLLPCLEDGGRILIGDVRNLDLLPAHDTAAERSRNRGRTTAGALAAQVRRRRRQETELLLSPAYFDRLPERFPELGAVDLLVKRGTGDNEMLAYRYDAVLTKGTAPAAEPHGPGFWRQAADAAGLRALLDDDAPDHFGVTGLTNPQVADDVRIAEELTRLSPTREIEPLHDGVRLTAQAAEEVRALQDALAHAEELGYHVAVTWSQDRLDGLDVVLRKGEPPRARARAPYRATHLANFPQIGDLGPAMARTLKDHLSAALPDYMVPSGFVLLEELPLTPNGKVDKRALPEPDEDDVAKEVYVAPRTEAQSTLAALVADILGHSRVGIRDSFLDIGGDSLMAVRLSMRVKKEMGAALSLQLVLSGATVEEMAESLKPTEPTEPAAPKQPTPPAEPAQPPEATQPTRAADTARPAAGDGTPDGAPDDTPEQHTAPGGPHPAGRNLPELPEADDTFDGDEAPLLPQQRDLWFLDRPAHLGSAHDNVQIVFLVEGPLDRDAYARSIRALVERHPALRTGYVQRDGAVLQRVHEADGFEVHLLETGDIGDDAVAAWLQAERARPFAPEGPHQLRAHLLAQADDWHTVVLTRPWGVFDGWSVRIVLGELLAHYHAFVRGEEPGLAPLPLRCTDVARRRGLHDAEAAAERDRQLDHWRKQLDGLPRCLSLRTDYPRGPVKSYRGASVDFEAGAELLDRLRKTSQEHGVTLYMTLLSAFAVLTGGHTDDHDLAIGAPVTNRPTEDEERLVGYFVTTLVMRLDITPERAFTDVLAQAREVVSQAHEHKDVTLTDLVEALAPEPDPAHSPLFQVMFNLIPSPDPEVEADGGTGDLSIVPLPAHPGTTRYDLSLTVQETASGLHGSLEYSTDLFTSRTAEDMARTYERLLQEIARHPGSDLARLRAEANTSHTSEGEQDR
ncbi:non-ribosomal peptide synthetase [Streptomyces cacaoi]|uniref:non-ribosomal peptide synthetase n=1 Tax=Streptomyces cacaoi TaxID=1898 RepID=UPI001FD466E4|nr:non-ribosomal peptide synthetase [Streptomyces cacaoi]